MYQKYHLDLRDYKDSLKLKGYAQTTINNYSKALEEFLEYTDKCRSHLSILDIDRYMISIKDKSYSIKNQSISAIKLYYKYVLNKYPKTNKLERPRKIRKLPDILSKQETEDIIDSIKHLKQKCIIATIYYFGLRRSEVCVNMKDFDKSRKSLHIRGAKGNKDRFISFQDKWVKIANEYVKQYHIKNDDSLFGDYSYSSMYKILQRALNECRIYKDISLHSLRRSYACHLYESGVSLLTIQKLLGHKNYKTTLLYVQVSEKSYEEAIDIL
jgi:site-specific recombinase XerD